MVITSVLLGLILYFRTVTGICPSFGTVVDLTAAFDSVGTLTTDHYPIGYYSDSNCRWLIEAQAPNQKVVLFIEDFNTEEDFDFLYIYDGNTESSTLLFSGSGTTHSGLWWISSTQYMFIQFTSDYSVQTTGISIKYVSSDGTVTGNDTACPYSIFGVVSAQFTMINDDVSCIYQVSVPSVQLIRFTMLINDRTSITVYDGASADPNLIMVQYGSSENTNTYQSTGTAIYITKPSGGKFIMHYERVDASEAAPTIVTSTPSPQEFSCSNIYLTATTTGYGLLASPFWPNHYPNNLQCSATITTTNSTASVQVTFTDVDILHCCDYLEIYDGSSSIFPSLGNTWSTGDVVTSTGSSLMLSFYSDSTGSLRGFQLQYLEVPRATPSCVPPDHSSVQASATEYILASPNYPSFYDNNMLEYWLITKPSEEDNIVLDIRNMHLETSFDCSYDKLTIYDGPCTTSPVMAVLCGNEERIFQDNSGLYVLIEFRTDGSVTYTGFEMIIYLGTYDEPDDLLDTLKYIIPIAVGAVVLIIVIGLICYYRQKRQKRNQQIVPGSKVIEAQVIKAPPPGLKRKTTHQLLAELQERYGRRDQDMKSKASRKAMERYQPEPGPSGLAQLSYPTQQPPYGIPPPSYVSAQSDPAYPPNFFETSAKGAFNAPIPTVVPSSGLAVARPTPASVLNTNLASVPAAPQYSTPSEARQAGLYG